MADLESPEQRVIQAQRVLLDHRDLLVPKPVDTVKNRTMETTRIFMDRMRRIMSRFMSRRLMNRRIGSQSPLSRPRHNA